ncbi:MAG: MarC family protein [Alphaproteobacteria bacterium]|jgi:multiple antibiotic resistance protein|nr:MarC family protein [Alphaproteobacteria bacterium]
MAHRLLQDFVLLLVAVNPALVVPEFVVVTAKFGAPVKRRIAIEAILIAGGVLLAFVAIGQVVLAGLNIELHAFQIAAGLILLLMSLRMVLEEAAHHESAHGRHPAVYPLAIPYLAGPKSIMTVLLLTDSDTYSLQNQLQIAGLVVLVLALTLGCLLGARWAHRLLRDTGVHIISRVMGLLLAALATQYILDALEQAFGFSR